MRAYQQDYAAGRPQMYDYASRKQKAIRIIKTLKEYFGQKNLVHLAVLDIGASTGIIDSVLTKSFKRVVGTDIDKKAILHAKKKYVAKNLQFKVENAMALSFKENSFDVVICTHVYEHVPDAKILFKEIYRVLKPNGVCYFAAINSLWPLEPHYNLPFLSYFPKPIANFYVKLFGKANAYYETPLSYWSLRDLCHKFQIHDFTAKILRNPKRYGYEDKLNGFTATVAYLLSPLATYLAPTFFWILKKKS